MGLLTLKTIPKHFLNNNKRTLPRSRIRLFPPQNCQNDPLKSQKLVNFWPKISIIEVIYRPLELKIHQMWAIEDWEEWRNTSYTTPKQLWERPANDFVPQIGQKRPSQKSKVGHILFENFDFSVHFWTFGAENNPKVGLFKNNTQTLPKQLQNNFNKVQKTKFSPPKLAKTRMSTWPKGSIFGSTFDLQALFLPC